MLGSKGTEGIFLLNMLGTPAPSSLHPSPFLSLLFPACHEVNRFLFHEFLLWYKAQKQHTSLPWPAASATVNENRPFLLLCISFQLFCYNNGQLTQKINVCVFILVQFLWRTLANKMSNKMIFAWISPYWQYHLFMFYFLPKYFINLYLSSLLILP